MKIMIDGTEIPTIKWYHKLYIWIFPTIIYKEWVGNELFEVYIKKVFDKYFVLKIKQIIYDVEKHIMSLKPEAYPFDKLLKNISVRNPSGFDWDEINDN